ncbi:carbohydrate-binding family 9-like protein [Lachnoclostridium sp.]|uniref:carbohydrate-binding family 9-like protein n=1 Tax=Lachnoclostridium sp. TaxID=2028282 RepID=UPI00289EDAFE|nr:carbohydrate-binding family 9-like protein [Lachnoclostridium sp.]
MKECPVCYIDHFQWTKGYRVEAFAQIALLDNYGLVVSMTAVEQNPLRRFTEDEDPVYQDSGLEIFINFGPDNQKFEYLNFEMNANGAMLSHCGTIKNRRKISDVTSYHAICKAELNDNDWNILLKIPMELICTFNEGRPLKQGDKFAFNCYKISEDPSIEHYASYSPIQNPVPNFHLPQFFAEATIVDC